MPSPSSVWVTVILYPIRTVVGALLWLRVWWWVDDQGCHLSQLLWQKHKQAILNTGVHKQNCSSLQLFFEKKPSVYKERNCHNCCDKTWQNGMVSFYVPKNIKGQFCPHLYSAAIVTNTKVFFFYLLSMWWLKTAQINRFDHSVIHKSFSPVFLFVMISNYFHVCSDCSPVLRMIENECGIEIFVLGLETFSTTIFNMNVHLMWGIPFVAMKTVPEVLKIVFYSC